MIGDRAGAAVLIGLLLGGCTLGPAPSVRVADARVVEQAPEGTLVEFDLEAVNDSADPLPLREASYSLDAGGQRVFDAARSPQVTVPAGGRIVFTLPVSLPMALPEGPMAYVLRGNIRYVAPGPLADAMYDNGLRRPSVSFRDEGTLEGR